MSIRFQFVRGDSWLDGVISWFSAGHFSHVDAVLPDGRLLGSQASRIGGQLAGVWVRPADYGKWTKRVVMELATTPGEETAFYNFLREQRGKSYDYKAIWGFLVNRDWRDPAKWFCSELMAAAAETAYVIPKLYVATWKITPVAFALALSAAGAKVVYQE